MPRVKMLSFTPPQQSNDVSRHGVGFSSSATSVVLRPRQLMHHPPPPILNSAPQPSAQQLHFAVDHRDARFILPNLLAQSLADHEIQNLVSAHWHEFMIEEIILAQRDDLEREADEIGQLQLAFHKLERARLEVEYYTDAISRIATNRSTRHPAPSEIRRPAGPD